ncbi:MAG: DUF2946 family protein [Sulfuritalea sp.]|nr:DUF2946 family protein [Sulfuritalea sp.]
MLQAHSGEAAATVNWPDVPACHGWLSLDRRGNWRLKGEQVRHAGLVAYLGRNYRHDSKGNWIVENGPQRVYVALDYTPLVFRIESDGKLLAHTGAFAGKAEAAWLDDEGCVLLETPSGVGLIDDRDLGRFLADCTTGNDGALPVDWLSAFREATLAVVWRGLPLGQLRSDEVASRFGFNPAPAA